MYNLYLVSVLLSPPSLHSKVFTEKLFTPVFIAGTVKKGAHSYIILFMISKWFRVLHLKFVILILIYLFVVFQNPVTFISESVLSGEDMDDEVMEEDEEEGVVFDPGTEMVPVGSQLFKVS